MGFIKSSLFISLDGVIEAPETWHFPYFNDQMGEAVNQQMSDTDATLLGRHTYGAFAAYWPTADPADPITGVMNGSRKYVVSNTLTEATWQNSSVISGDVAAELTKLKADTRLGTTGSATLVRWLLEHGLVDELHLLVHPIVVGHGKKLFADGATVPLKLMSSTTFDTGVVTSSTRALTTPRPATSQPTDRHIREETSMRYMVMHYQTQEMEDGILPSAEQQAAIGEYMQEAAMSGVLLAGEGVASSSQGARVEVNDGKVRVIDGPFAEAKELIAGFAILEVDSLGEAVEHARRFALLVGSERVDVRRVIEFEDLRQEPQ